MPYLKKTTKVGNRIYVEKVFSARYGKRTIPGPKKNKTDAAVKKQQQREREKKLRWLIEANFVPGDWHVTLTFRKDCRTTDREKIKAIKKEFMNALRKIYKKEGKELKFVCVTEKLKTCVHFHVVLNDIPHLAKEVTCAWKYGRAYTSSLYESDDGFKQLASYMIKEDHVKGEQSYSRSRNLIIPETKVEVISAKKWTKEPKAKKGYYIQKGSVKDGISEITGYQYQYYTMIKIRDD